MACGCKGKKAAAPAPAPNTVKTVKESANIAVQESIKKTVEKYYKKK